MKWRNLIFQMVVILLSYSNNRLVKNQFWVGTNWLAETQTMLSGSTNWERPTEEPARGSGGCGGDNGLLDNGRHSRLCPLVCGGDSHPKPRGLQPSLSQSRSTCTTTSGSTCSQISRDPAPANSQLGNRKKHPPLRIFLSG